MNRISEDVSRVRMYMGPALMYFVNLVSLMHMMPREHVSKRCVFELIVLSPLPLLAGYNLFECEYGYSQKKASKCKRLLSDLTTHAQESYSAFV
jgi:ATP-binding cassette subfamily B protein